MMRDRVMAMEEAIAWHLRAADTGAHGMGADEWRRFVTWLEADPAHAAAYDHVALADAARHADDDLPMPANDLAPPRRRPAWIGFGVASGAAAAALAWLAIPGLHAPAGRVIVAPADGARRIALADGSRVALARGAALRIGGEAGDPRAVRLERGSATFTVRHDAAHPFRLTIGSWTVQDVGTVFSVSRTGGGFRLSVAEGAVGFDPDGRAIIVRAGQMLDVDAAGEAALTAGDVPGAAPVNRLTFDAASLPEVALAVGRASHVRVSVAPALRERSFTGIVHLTGRAQEDIPHIAQLAGTGWRRDEAGWMLVPIAEKAR